MEYLIPLTPELAVERVGQHPNYHAFSDDQYAVILMINNLFNERPELFGDEEQRARLQTRTLDILQSQMARDDFFNAFAKMLHNEGINPFNDISVLCVGFDEPLLKDVYPFFYVFNEKTAGFRDMFERFIDINDERNKTLTQGNAMDIVDGKKVDYVITGNVLNDPEMCDFPDEVMYACAIAAKKGATVFHMLGYSSDNYPLIFNKNRLRFSGQEHVGDVPNINNGEEVCSYLHLRQIEEREHLPGTWYKLNIGNRRRDIKDLSTTERRLIENPELIARNGFAAPDTLDPENL